jgi:hypothetical protein
MPMHELCELEIDSAANSLSGKSVLLGFRAAIGHGNASIGSHVY